MLAGIRETPIIAGAYTSPEGTCPMLAAHRRGGRTSLATFARAWDRYTRAERGPRPATERELRTLEAMLETSLAAEELPPAAGDLGRAVAEHRALRRPRPGDPDRSSELRRRPGWSWLRVFHRLDDYEAALEAVAERRPSPDATEPLSLSASGRD